MKQLYFLVSLIFFNTAVSSGQDHTGKSDTSTAKKPEIIVPTVDPYFVKSWDTASSYGPYSITRNILQDRKGNYWFATWQGIVRYDGKLFTNFTLKEGLIPFHVVSLFEDSKGILWFGTVRGGLYRYDGRSFTLFTTNDGLSGNLIHCMLEDKAGNIWFGTEGGASRYDGATFTNLTLSDGLAGIGIWTMLQDKTGKLWFGCLNPDKINEGGISCYDGQRLTNFHNKDGLPFKNVTVIKEDKNGNIMIGTREGLCRYNPSLKGAAAFTDLLQNFVGQMFVDKAGMLWLSVSEPNTHYSKDEYPYNQYLCRYDGKSFEKVIERYYSGDTQVFGITEDSAGRIWFGTMKGPCCYDGKSFTYFSKEQQ